MGSAASTLPSLSMAAPRRLMSNCIARLCMNGHGRQSAKTAALGHIHQKNRKRARVGPASSPQEMCANVQSADRDLLLALFSVILMEIAKISMVTLTLATPSGLVKWLGLSSW